MDLYPALRAFVDAGRVPDDDLVRAELFRRFGFYPTESSEHHAEYNPWFIPKGDPVERFHIPIGEYLDRVANNLDEYDETKRRLDAGEPFEIERSGEYAAVIVHSLRDRRAGAGIVGNVMNTGGSSRTSPPMPAWRCPALSTAPASIRVAVGPLPAAVRGLRPPGGRHAGADGPGRPATRTATPSTTRSCRTRRSRHA